MLDEGFLHQREFRRPSHPDCLRISNLDSEYPLHDACARGYLDKVRPIPPPAHCFRGRISLGVPETR